MTPETQPARSKDRWLLCALAVLVWIIFSLTLKSQYRLEPVGDAAYYTNMSYSFFEPFRSDIPISTIHGKRILVPFLVHLGLRAWGTDTSVPLVWAYNPDGDFKHWTPHQQLVYARIHRLWQGVNFIAFSALVVLLNLLIPELPLSRFSAYWASLILTPSFTFLFVFWPQMGDLTCSALCAGAFCLLQRERTALGLLTFSLAALCREQVFLFLPLLYFIRRVPLWQLGLTLVPYFLVSLFPAFPNQKPFVDISSGAAETSARSHHAYLAILAYHAGQLLSARGLVYPLSVLLNFGGTWILSRQLGLNRTWLIRLCLALCFVFIADRHMVPLNLIVLYYLAVKSKGVKEDSLFEVGFLWALAAFKTYMLMRRSPAFLQLEVWARIMKPAKFGVYSAVGILAWLALLARPRWGRKREPPSSVPTAPGV